jgi:hypothetical protein
LYQKLCLIIENSGNPKKKEDCASAFTLRIILLYLNAGAPKGIQPVLNSVPDKEQI